MGRCCEIAKQAVVGYLGRTLYLAAVLDAIPDEEGMRVPIYLISMHSRKFFTIWDK